MNDEQAHIIETQKRIIRFERKHKEALLEALETAVALVGSSRAYTISEYKAVRDVIAAAQGGAA